MTIYLAYFEKNTFPDYKLGPKIVGVTSTTPTVGERLHFKEVPKVVALQCGGLSLFGDPKHNPGMNSEVITMVKGSTIDRCILVEVVDGSYLLEEIA